MVVTAVTPVTAYSRIYGIICNKREGSNRGSLFRDRSIYRRVGGHGGHGGGSVALSAGYRVTTLGVTGSHGGSQWR